MRSLLLTALSAFAVLPAFAVLTVQFTVWNETCGNGNGAISVQPQGGTPPYQYAWSNGANQNTATGLGPGWYVLTLTDALGQTLVDSAQVLAVPNLDWPAAQQFPQGGLFGCNNCNAGLHFIADPIAFNWYNVSGMMTVISPTPLEDLGANGYILGPYCAWEQPTITVSDATGCTGNVTVPLFTSPGGSPQLIDLEGACLTPNGSITVDPWGGGFTVDLWTATLYDANWNTVQACDSWNCGSPFLTFSGLAAGDYHMVRMEDYYDPYGMSCPPETLDVSVPDLGPTCGQLNGSLFFDHDQDCTQDANDEPMPFRVMAIAPGPQYLMTNAAGTFSRNLGYGSYSLDQQAGGELIQLCPVPSPIPFTLSSGSPTAQIDIADSSAIPFDLTLFGTHGPTRLGFDASYTLQVRNLSGALSGPVTVSFTIDPVLTYVNASPAPSDITGNVLTWDLPALGAFGTHYLSVSVNVPPIPALLGTVVTCTASASTNTSESTLVNNSATLNSTITGAYDPNDKTVQTSSGYSDAQYFIGTDEWLDYTIRFQNTGTDTAFTVVITDTLPLVLDPLSFQPGAASHPYDVAMSGAGLVTFTFANILLPDSNVNEPASNGFVGFRIKLHQPVLPGTIVSNAADIYFDFNPPVHTNDAVVVAETSTSLNEGVASTGMRLFPNPAHEELVLSLDAPATIEVLDLSGRSVLRATGRGPLTHLAVGTLSAGQYILRATTTAGTRWARFTKAD